MNKLKLVVMIAMTISSISGCAVKMAPTRIPELVEDLKKHDFSKSERDTIGKLLKYINDLENQ